MKSSGNKIYTFLSIISFLLLCITSIFWFLLIYWKYPAYSTATDAFISHGSSGIKWLIYNCIYMIAFFPVVIALIVIFIEYIFLKRKRKILKICISLFIIFALSTILIPFLISKGSNYISRFNPKNWADLPYLRYESVENLTHNYNLKNMSLNTLFNILGPENYVTESLNGKNYYWDLKNPLSLNNEYLKITINHGKIIDFYTINAKDS